MNWEALGALAELLGAISVFLTLIYLARQINENSKLQKISAYNAMITGFSDLYSWIGTSRELAAVSKYMFRPLRHFSSQRRLRTSTFSPQQ